MTQIGGLSKVARTLNSSVGACQIRLPGLSPSIPYAVHRLATSNSTESCMAQKSMGSPTDVKMDACRDKYP